MMENADIRKRGELLASFYIIMIIKPEVKNPNVACQNRKKNDPHSETFKTFNNFFNILFNNCIWMTLIDYCQR